MFGVEHGSSSQKNPCAPISKGQKRKRVRGDISFHWSSRDGCGVHRPCVHVKPTSMKKSSGSSNGGTLVPYFWPYFGGIFPEIKPLKIGIIYVRYLQFRSLKWPLTTFALWSQVDHADFPSSNIPKLSIRHLLCKGVVSDGTFPNYFASFS